MRVYRHKPPRFQTLDKVVLRETVPISPRYVIRAIEIGKCTVDAMLHNPTLVIGRYDKQGMNIPRSAHVSGDVQVQRKKSTQG